MIQWDRVTELREEVGEADFAEVVALFLDEVENVLSRLREMPRRESMEDDLHFLKSSALTLGFSGFSDICQFGERLAARAEFDSIDIGAVLSTYDASKREFLSRLGLAA